jgi:hypothetical protein
MMIKLKKITNRTQFNSAIWAVVGHEDIRVHQIGATRWLADHYDEDGNYVKNIMKFSDKSALLEALGLVVL